jgi:hypothetical protein
MCGFRWQLNRRPSYKVSVANVDHNSCIICIHAAGTSIAIMPVSTTVNVTRNYRQPLATTKVDKQCSFLDITGFKVST